MEYYDDNTTQQQDLKHKNQARLMETIGFTEDDLIANQNGYMTKRQRTILSERRAFWRFLIRVIIGIVPVAIAITIAEGYRIKDTPASRFGICLVILILAGVGIAACSEAAKKLNKDLLKGDVAFEEGKARFFGSNRVIIADIMFETSSPPNPFRGFKRGEIYRVFYVPVCRIIISAEWIAAVGKSKSSLREIDT